MKKILLSLAIASLAFGGWAMLEGTPSAIPSEGAPTASQPDSSVAPLFSEPGCAEPDALLLPEGVEAGPQQACCIDQCHTDIDCFFRCGGKPGKCVMRNPCCTECDCGAVSSFTLTS